ncbi:hypothetical protein ACHAXT_005385 [Thalassiosira profunda]
MHPKQYASSDVHQTQYEQQNNRRTFLEGSALSLSYAFGSAGRADARGLVRFPCKEPFLNTYHFLRAGSSLLEVEDIWSTNPLFLTNREAALSEIGEAQVREACRYLKSTGSNPTVVRYSLAAASIDSANIVGEELRVGRDRLVPEFNYMDPRAIGGWDGSALNATEEAVWALDFDEAGPYGKGGKPPPNEDGTPAETLADQVVRLTNLMSVLETLYSGDTVLLVFPDGTGPALLSCLIAGIPLNRVHELQFCPGEIRCGVDYNSILALASRPPSPVYFDIIQRGRAEMKQLRENPDLLRNVKDLKYEEEREEERKVEEAKRKEAAKALEMERQKQKEEAAARKAEADAAKAARAKEAREKELERRRKREEKMKLKEGDTTEQDSLDSGTVGIGGAALAGVVVAAVAFGGGGDTEDVAITSATNVVVDASNEALNATSSETGTAADEPSFNLTDLAVESVAESGDGREEKVIADGGDNATDIDAGDKGTGDVTNLTNETEVDATLLDERPEEQMELINPQPTDVPGVFEDVVSLPPEEPKPREGVDYDDAWLAEIADIMNDDEGS